MEANELMIGDWVKITHLNKIGTVYRIDKANGYGNGFAAVINGDYHEGNLEPIPLTPEILEKNGFGKVLDEDGIECYRYYNHAADGYIKISLHDGGDGDWSVEIINYEKFDDNKIVYNNSFIFLTVHQLQHALRLCGIEKEIIL